VLTMLHAGQDLPLGSPIAGRLVGDDHPHDVSGEEEVNGCGNSATSR
jgi:hypothetical protein